MAGIYWRSVSNHCCLGERDDSRPLPGICLSIDHVIPTNQVHFFCLRVFLLQIVLRVRLLHLFLEQWCVFSLLFDVAVMVRQSSAYTDASQLLPALGIQAGMWDVSFSHITAQLDMYISETAVFWSNLTHANSAVCTNSSCAFRLHSSSLDLYSSVNITIGSLMGFVIVWPVFQSIAGLVTSSSLFVIGVEVHNTISKPSGLKLSFIESSIRSTLCSTPPLSTMFQLGLQLEHLHQSRETF